MSDYTVKAFTDAPDVMGDYPGEMRFLKDVLDTEQVSVTYRRMPPETGGKGSYGHSHKTQEEVYLVLSGTLQFKVGDEVFDVGAGHAVRMAPQAVRSVWNASDSDVELIMVSTSIEDLRADLEFTEEFWPL
jgi:mannose-6-phosphate isomerase-like protein (cupin superfamily)